MPTMIIDQDCVFNPNKNDQLKLKNALMKEVAMKDLHKLLPWAKNTAVCVTAVLYFNLTTKDRAGGLKVGDR